MITAKNTINIFKELKAPVAGQSPESIIYLPLFTKEKKIGVITVQSFFRKTRTMIIRLIYLETWLFLLQ